MKNVIFLLFCFSAFSFAESSISFKSEKVNLSEEKAQSLGITFTKSLDDDFQDISISTPKLIQENEYLHTQVCLFLMKEKITCFFAMDSEEFDSQGNETGNIEVEYYFNKNHINEHEVNITYGTLVKTYVIKLAQ